MLSLIVAMSANGVIGLNNKIPWYLPEDLKNFKKITNNCVVVMGRKTYESILNENRKYLPNRKNIVITNNTNRYQNINDDLVFVNSFESAVDTAKKYDKDIFFIGGCEIYKQCFPIIDRAYISIIKCCCDGDTFFPDFDWYDWRKVSDTDMGSFILRIMDKIK